MTNLPVGNIVTISTANLPTIAAEIERIVDNAGNNAAAALLKSKALEQENEDLRHQVAELRHALRTLSSQVQAAMPTLTALVEQRDTLAAAWAQAAKVLRETGK